MKALFASLSLCLALLVVATAPGCGVEVQDTLPYACTADADCGGGGFTCVSVAERPSFCCKKAAEVCNALDDDCDGTVDELEGEPCYEGPEGTRDVGACRAGHPACGEGTAVRCADQVLPAAAESCNGVDDDCDGTVDEDFDLRTNSAHCGQCGRACSADQVCVLSQCVRRLETCSDDVDNDGDGQNNCADSDCESQECGAGCVCTGGAPKELACADGADNDGTDGADCADIADCEGKSCNTLLGGCTCAGGKAQETACGDGKDNDGTEGADCADTTDCEGKSCNAQGGCTCTAGVAQETNCADGLNNDGTEGADCADTADCNGKSCNAQGGCTCTGGVAKETSCTDLADNDGDKATDCADSVDCPLGTVCRLPNNSGNGTCKNNKTCG